MKLSLPLSFLLYLPALATAEERSPDAPLLRALQDQAVRAEAEAGQRQLSKYGDASKRDRELGEWVSSESSGKSGKSGGSGSGSGKSGKSGGGSRELEWWGSSESSGKSGKSGGSGSGSGKSGKSG